MNNDFHNTTGRVFLPELAADFVVPEASKRVICRDRLNVIVRATALLLLFYVRKCFSVYYTIDILKVKG